MSGSELRPEAHTNDSFQPVAGIPPFQPITGGPFILGPELAAWGPSDANLFVFAVGADLALWYAELTGFIFDDPPATWSAWQSLGGVVTSHPRAVRSGEASIDVFAMGANSELLHWQFANGAWVTHGPVVKGEADADARATGVIPPVGGRRYWESLGGILTSAPDAVLFGELDDEVLVFARGTDQALWSRARQGSTWTPWISLGHLLASAPSAAVVQKETFAVVALGIDSAIWYTMGGAWHSLGGTFSSPPYAVGWGRFLDVFATDSGGALKYRRWDGSSWTGWQNLGGILMTPPIADAPPEGLPYVFTLGTDSGVWRRRSNGGSEWADWESLGTGLLTLPATVVRNPIDIDNVRALAALGFDHRVWFQEDDF